MPIHTWLQSYATASIYPHMMGLTDTLLDTLLDTLPPYELSSAVQISFQMK